MRFKRKTGVRACALLVCLCLFFTLTSCSTLSDSERFARFTRESFVGVVSSDGLSLHSSLRDPAAYGITEFPLLGDILPEDDGSESDFEEAYKFMRTFNYDKLTTNQQTLYDTLMHNIKLNEQLVGFEYYDEINGADSGIQGALLFSLAEYTFYTEDDIENYFKLLSDVPRYFEDDVEYQKIRAEKGLFMSDEALDRTLETMDEVLKEPENNVLLQSFTERLDKLDALESEKREEYTKTNVDLVLQTVIPAFQSLRDGLSALRGSGKNDKGIAHLPDGKLYYSLLARSRTGLDQTVEEMAQALDERMMRLVWRMQSLLQSDAALIDRYSQVLKTIEVPDTPAEMVRLFEQRSDEFFPPIDTVEFTINEVPASLQESTAAAFYLIPPVDAAKENVIYYNPKYGESGLSLASTLAHEGYPGHLYQNNYARTVFDDPAQTLYGPLGYSEGWAVYAESYVYRLLGLRDESVIEMLQIDSELNRLLSARADIGVHYEGWDRRQLAGYLEGFGISGGSVVDGTYNQLLANAAAFLPYALGSMEMQRLLTKAERTLGESFDLIEFHRTLLDCGKAYFDTIEKHVDAYIKRSLLPAADSTSLPLAA